MRWTKISPEKLFSKICWALKIANFVKFLDQLTWHDQRMEI